MARCACVLALWLVGISLVGNALTPTLSRLLYPQPLDLVVLAFIPIGAYHAAKYEAPKVLFLLYGCLASSVFALNFTVWHWQNRIGLTLLYHPEEAVWRILMVCVVTLAFGFACRWAPDARKKWAGWRRIPEGRCRKCGYNLTGNVSGICPECGEKTDGHYVWSTAMAAHIGIVACSAEGAALCYRTICMEASTRMGEHNHPQITMHTYPLVEYMRHIRSGNWEGVAELMLSSVRKVAQAGARLAICPDNTIHQAFELVIPESPIPWLHIARAVAEEARSRGFSRLGILGTKYLMTGPVYPKALRDYGISCEIPADDVRERIDEIIFTELVNGVCLEESRLYFHRVIEGLKEQGCDAVVLGCTEIPLIVDPDGSCLPTLDSTRLLARAALREAIEAG